MRVAEAPVSVSVSVSVPFPFPPVLSLIAYANPFLHVALLALHVTAPLKFTVTPLRPPLNHLAVATPTAEGGASVAGRGVPVALPAHGACGKK